jgi:hypothetical protein
MGWLWNAACSIDGKTFWAAVGVIIAAGGVFLTVQRSIWDRRIALLAIPKPSVLIESQGFTLRSLPTQSRDWRIFKVSVSRGRGKIQPMKQIAGPGPAWDPGPSTYEPSGDAKRSIQYSPAPHEAILWKVGDVSEVSVCIVEATEATFTKSFKIAV